MPVKGATYLLGYTREFGLGWDMGDAPAIVMHVYTE